MVQGERLVYHAHFRPFRSRYFDRFPDEAKFDDSKTKEYFLACLSHPDTSVRIELIILIP